MTPYYQDEFITIYNGDCKEILPFLPSADLVLTDPPYGLGNLWVGGGGTQKTSWRFNPKEAQSWDGATADIVISLPKKAKFSIIWGGNYYPLPPSRCWFLWDKKQNDRWTTGQAEMAWTNINRPIRVFRMAQCTAHAEMKPKLHPTQKPLSLMLWCFSMLKQDVHTVLDPFIGSGTTLVAAKQLGKRAIGVELNERYCEIAAKRLQQLPLAA